MNNFSNRATWLTVNAFENSSDRIKMDYNLCDSTSELYKCFMRHVGKMEDGEELLELRNEINWREILDNKE